MAHWREVLPPAFMLEIDYEELVADRERITRRMIDFIRPGLERCMPAPGGQPARRENGQHVAGAPADVPHLCRTLAAL